MSDTESLSDEVTRLADLLQVERQINATNIDKIKKLEVDLEVLREKCTDNQTLQQLARDYKNKYESANAMLKLKVNEMNEEMMKKLNELTAKSALQDSEYKKLESCITKMAEYINELFAQISILSEQADTDNVDSAQKLRESEVKIAALQADYEQLQTYIEELTRNNNSLSSEMENQYTVLIRIIEAGMANLKLEPLD